MDFYRVNTGNTPQESVFGGIGNVGFFNTDLINDDTSSKLSHDRYEVFVNKDKVGDKLLLTQVDNPMDIDKYLKNHGFENFKTNVEGDHILVQTDDPKERKKMKTLLSTYLDIR